MPSVLIADDHAMLRTGLRHYWSRTVRSTRLRRRASARKRCRSCATVNGTSSSSTSICRIAVASTSCGIFARGHPILGSRDEWLFRETIRNQRAAGRGVRLSRQGPGARGIHAGCSYRTRRASFRKRHTERNARSAPSMSRPISPCTLHFHSASSRFCASLPWDAASRR